MPDLLSPNLNLSCPFCLKSLSQNPAFTYIYLSCSLYNQHSYFIHLNINKPYMLYDTVYIDDIHIMNQYIPSFYHNVFIKSKKGIYNHIYSSPGIINLSKDSVSSLYKRLINLIAYA